MANFVLPSDPKQRSALCIAVQAASNAKLRIDAEKELLKSIADRMKEEVGIPPALFNSLAQAHFKQDLEARQSKSEELFDTYSLLFKTNQQQDTDTN